MESKMTPQDLILNLKAAGFEKTMIETYISCGESGRINEQLKLLAEKRANLLAHIHQEEKQIDCLDYLVYQIEKGRATV